MDNAYLLKVYPVGRGREVYRKIEISGNATLDDLCSIILESFDFMDEHLYEFCMDNRMYSEYSYQSSPMSVGPSTKIKIDRLELREKQKFLLHYDFGDDWQFAITVEKISRMEDIAEPRIVKQKGEIEQYPDMEEWEW